MRDRFFLRTQEDWSILLPWWGWFAAKMFLFHCLSCCVGNEKQQCHRRRKKKSISQTFGFLPGPMMLCAFEKSPSPYTLQPVISREDDTVAEKTGQLCPFVSPGLLNESWNWFLSRWHLHQGLQLAILCCISSPKERGRTLYWMQVNSVLSSCLGNRPLKTSCLSEALTSSALIALTGSSRLFISPFSDPKSVN